MDESSRLWTREFVLLNLQFMLVSAALALFFPFQAYLLGLGFSRESAGFVIGADALASLVAQPLAAMFIHAGNARRCLVWSALGLALALLLQGRLQGVAPLILVRLAQGCGFSGVIAALVTLIVQSIPPKLSGEAFGWVSLVRLVPYAAVPSALELSGFVPQQFGTLMVLGALLVLCPLLMLALVPTVSRNESGAEGAARPGAHGIVTSLKNRTIVRLLLSGLLLYAGYAGAFFYLRGLGDALGFSAGGMFFSIATAAMMAVRLAGAWFFDRFDKVRLSVLGFVVTATAYALLPWSPHVTVFLGLAALLGLGWGAVMPLQSALLFDVSPPAARSLNQNLLLVCMQAGFFLGPVLGGLLWSVAGFTSLFVAAALTSLGAAGLTAGIPAAARRNPASG